MPKVPVLDHDAVLAAVSPLDAISHTREAFLKHHAGEWTMPPKVYLQSAPFGDFRAMPALGGGFAMLKWISSFPGNPGKGLAAVHGVVLLSDAETSEPRAIIDARAVTALRTGAVAAVASTALAAEGATTVGLIGAGLHGLWAARCMAAAGYGPGIAADRRVAPAQALCDELGNGWRVGSNAEALQQDIVCCVTPGAQVVVQKSGLLPGQHFNMLGADGSGKAEAEIDAVATCELYCDEWAQASHGGELTGAVENGLVTRENVVDLGAVLAGESASRSSQSATTMFDSTGLAIQDLAIALAALRALDSGTISATMVDI